MKCSKDDGMVFRKLEGDTVETIRHRLNRSMLYIRPNTPIVLLDEEEDSESELERSPFDQEIPPPHRSRQYPPENIDTQADNQQESDNSSATVQTENQQESSNSGTTVQTENQQESSNSGATVQTEEIPPPHRSRRRQRDIVGTQSDIDKCPLQTNLGSQRRRRRQMLSLPSPRRSDRTTRPRRVAAVEAMNFIHAVLSNPPQSAETLDTAVNNNDVCIRATSTSGDLKSCLKELREQFQDNCTSVQRIIVFRKSFWTAFFALSKTTFNQNAELYVKFSGEMGDDQGGPRREFFRILMKELQESELFEGQSLQKLFSHNIEALEKKNTKWQDNLLPCPWYRLKSVEDFQAKDLFLSKHGDWLVDQGISNA
ncbi:G2H3 [Mytilus edulis]|uniref:G2H3 n=1 Tax=Mytilus edulis TaxID=6550 RepID=A0A8S3PU30_MYTED|nr:G2H3 [Mytilus edulis]